ncbi:MAG: hypothetical protein WC997_08335 [Porticoccaceae bacterium]
MSDEDDLEDVSMDDDNTVEEAELKPSPTADLEARRRLEAKLEEKRLSKLIQDYDFDLD